MVKLLTTTILSTVPILTLLNKSVCRPNVQPISANLTINEYSNFYLFMPVHTFFSTNNDKELKNPLTTEDDRLRRLKFTYKKDEKGNIVFDGYDFKVAVIFRDQDSMKKFDTEIRKMFLKVRTVYGILYESSLAVSKEKENTELKKFELNANAGWVIWRIFERIKHHLLKYQSMDLLRTLDHPNPYSSGFSKIGELKISGISAMSITQKLDVIKKLMGTLKLTKESVSTERVRKDVGLGPESSNTLNFIDFMYDD